MKKIENLTLGFPDAENYKRRENKELFNQVFIKNRHLERLCDPAISFLMGEKGTGKTAYAVYLANNDYKNTLSSLRYIRETDYQKFINLKTDKHLQLSDYTSIWKVIIYLLLSQHVIEYEGGIEFLRRFTKVAEIQNAIDEYYNSAFSPEILQALEFVRESKIAAELMAKYAKAKGEQKEGLKFSENRFQSNLYYIQRSFESALSQARCKKNHILFIDGIDIRPASIPYSEYLDCIKGLANAVWEINNDFFPTIKGGEGRLRAVLLVRPDIFATLGLQNQNTKSRANSVFLDWRTEYLNHRGSELFRVTDQLLSVQQDKKLALGHAWDYYFPWNAPNVHETFSSPSSFISFLRWSYYRPRDILSMLTILQEIHIESGSAAPNFPYEAFDNANFKRRYADYLLGEIKDQLLFYYKTEEYELLIKFFEVANGRSKFSYEDYKEIYSKFRASIYKDNSELPDFLHSPAALLQFLYELNIICYIERPVDDKPYPRWCFRERSYANIAPKVKEGVEYQVFYGLFKSLNVGKEFWDNS
jgi:hypothetical protein